MGTRVLVVDDDQGVAQVLSDFLSGQGVTVDRASDGEEALRKLEEARADLLLVDILLPKINGLDLCRRIKQRDGAPAVFLMSGVYRSQELQRQALEQFQADGYLVKPFRLEELWSAIEPRLRQPLPRPPSAPLEGALETVGFARLLITLHGGKDSGALCLMQDAVRKVIYLERGVPVAVDSTFPTERFEDFVASHGIVESDLSEPIERDRWTRRYMTDCILSCFLVRHATFRFMPGEMAPFGLPRAELQVAELVLAGVRRHIPLAELSQEMSLLQGRVIRPTPSASALLFGVSLDPAAASLLSAIDGRATVDQVLERSGIERQLATQLLIGFLLLRILTASDSAPSSEPFIA